MAKGTYEQEEKLLRDTIDTNAQEKRNLSAQVSFFVGIVLVLAIVGMFVSYLYSLNLDFSILFR